MSTSIQILLTCLIIFIVMKNLNELAEGELTDFAYLCWSSVGVLNVIVMISSLIAYIWGY